MSRLRRCSVSILLILAVVGFSPRTHRLCSGFLPPNDRRIPVPAPSAMGEAAGEVSGMTQKQFNEVLDLVQKIYAPEVAAHGGELRIERLWEDATVNASASRAGGLWLLHMYGGLARHPAMTQDGFALVACHEMGHHVGGAPKGGWLMRWASKEGQSDYYANLKCLRRVFTDPASSSSPGPRPRTRSPKRPALSPSPRRRSKPSACAPPRPACR